MNYSNLSRKSIVLIITLLLTSFLIGCGKRIVNNQDNNQFEGIWEMEYTKSLPSFIEPWFNEDPISITLNSVLRFEADSFNLQIIAPNSYQYLNKEYAGNYSISADTIIFNATYSLSFNRFETNDSIINNEFDLSEKLRFNFDNQDSLTLNVVGIAVSDNMFSIPLSSFLWDTRYDWGPSHKSSGNYSRIDIE